MSVLSSLKLVAAKRPQAMPAIQVRRNKLSNKLYEQIKLATALSEGKNYSPLRLRTFRNKETGEIKTRTVEPWVLRSIAGQWLVLGYDEYRKEARNFMLRRIVSPVTQVLDSKKSPLTFDAPEQSVLDEAVEALNKHAKSQEAVLSITPGSEAWFRYELDLVPNKKDTIHKMNYHDVFVLAEQLREYADQIEVLEPKKLSELVSDGFRKVAEAHG